MLDRREANPRQRLAAKQLPEQANRSRAGRLGRDLPDMRVWVPQQGGGVQRRQPRRVACDSSPHAGVLVERHRFEQGPRRPAGACDGLHSFRPDGRIGVAQQLRTGGEVRLRTSQPRERAQGRRTHPGNSIVQRGSEGGSVAIGGQHFERERCRQPARVAGGAKLLHSELRGRSATQGEDRARIVLDERYVGIEHPPLKFAPLQLAPDACQSAKGDAHDLEAPVVERPEQAFAETGTIRQLEQRPQPLAGIRSTRRQPHPLRASRRTSSAEPATAAAPAIVIASVRCGAISASTSAPAPRAVPASAHAATAAPRACSARRSTRAACLRSAVAYASSQVSKSAAP